MIFKETQRSWDSLTGFVLYRSQYAYERQVICSYRFAILLTIGRKEAIQKTIMSMTLGKDVSALFPDVLKNIATPDLDQKKLVYLYLM